MTFRKTGFTGALIVLTVVTLAPFASAFSRDVANRCDGSDRHITVTSCLRPLRGD